MKLLVQPGDGTKALVQAIQSARKSIEVVIFRFDCRNLERALEEAAERGVAVHALIAFTNRGGEKNLRKLEAELLGRGITVSRTNGDLLRYHGKMMIVDRRRLFLMAFNFTHLDIDQSRSFGIITTAHPLVREAVQLFECDAKRQPYTAGCSHFVVSPVNARERLADFIRRARKTLWIYDVEVSDPAMIRLLQERSKAGVEIRLIGGLSRKRTDFPARDLNHLRLHARAMVRDGKDVFLGSQSMRAQELDSRREIGIIVRDLKIAAAITRMFDEDWEKSATAAAAADSRQHEGPPAKALKRVAKIIRRELPEPPALAKVVKEIIEDQTNGPIDREEVEDAVRSAVKEAVADAVKHAVEVVVEREVVADMEKK